jgi:hypothetical protein
MSKAVINAYRGYTAAAIKAKASVPAQADMAIVGSTVECAISNFQIRDVLGTGETSFHDQANSAALNRFSGFGPIKRTVVGGVLTNSIEDPNGIFEFAGYNHGAVAPHFDSDGVDITDWRYPGETLVFDVVADIGELRYIDISGREDAAAGVAFSVWEGSTLIDVKVKALAGLTNIADFSTNAGDRISFMGPSSGKTYTCKIEIIDSDTVYDYTGDHIICRVPGLATYNVTISIKQANSIYLSANADWLFEGTTPNFTNQGHLVFQALSHKPSGSYVAVHAEITAWVEDWTGARITAIQSLFHDTDSSFGTCDVHVFRNMANTADLDNGLLTSGYGYRVVVFVNEHPA